MYAEAQAAHTGRHLHTSSPLLRVFMASGAEHEFTERFKQERNSASLPDMCFRHVQRCKDNECVLFGILGSTDDFNFAFLERWSQNVQTVAEMTVFCRVQTGSEALFPAATSIPEHNMTLTDETICFNLFWRLG